MSRNVVQASRVRQQIRRRKQSGGYMLVELGLYLAIATFILAGQFSDVMAAINESDAIGTAKYAQKLQGAVNDYVNKNDVALKSGNAITGFATVLEPKVTELIAQKYLEDGFSTRSPLGLTFQTKLTRTGACPGGSDCKIDGFAYSTQGYKDGEGRLRTDILTTAVTHIGPDAGMSLAESPLLLTSPGGGTTANPAGSVAGTLGIRVGSGSGLLPLLSQYYKLDGSKPLAGAMNANSNDINSVRNLQVTGTTTTENIVVSGNATLTQTAAPGATCTAAESGVVRRNGNGVGLVVCNGSAYNAVGNAVVGISDGGACTTAGQLGVNGTTGAAFICNGSYWASANTNANLGDACAPAGRTATSVATREQLVCSNGKYVKLANLLSRQVEVMRILVKDGDTFNKPACEVGGTASYSFQLTQTVVDVSVTPPRQAMYIAAVDNGTAWAVKIKVKDNTGAEVTANNYSVTAVMKLECAY